MTTPVEQRPTLAERYSRATQSSHLQATEHAGDVDLLIAAGWVKDSLGAMLYRLRSEFDDVRREIEAAQGELLRSQRAVDELLARARHAGEDQDGAAMLAEAERLRLEAERCALTSRLMILSKLKTLGSTKEALGRWAVVQATKRRYMRNDAAVLNLAGRVLNVFLDPNCASCQGRGFNGGYGHAKVLCRACAGSGKRRATLGKDAEEREFGGRLLSEIEAMLAEVDSQMRRYLRSNPEQG